MGDPTSDPWSSLRRAVVAFASESSGARVLDGRSPVGSRKSTGSMTDGTDFRRNG